MAYYMGFCPQDLINLPAIVRQFIDVHKIFVLVDAAQPGMISSVAHRYFFMFVIAGRAGFFCLLKIVSHLRSYCASSSDEFFQMLFRRLRQKP